MPILLTDPEREEELRAERSSSDGDKWNEVWDGVLVMPTMPNDEHQEIQANLLVPLILANIGKVRGGVNVTDRHPDWKENFRGSDVVVYLPDNPAINYGTHWLGGPDFLVEIVSPGDMAWDKLEFYAEVKTREVLIVDRDPWRLELYRLEDGVLEPAGSSDLSKPDILASRVLPFTFQLVDGGTRPHIRIVHTGTGQGLTA
ncbi:MAG: Uma2 family endonuclease [Gemmataceae bacterium]